MIKSPGNAGNTATPRAFFPGNQQITTIGVLGNGSASFQYIENPSLLTASRVDALVSWSAASAANNSTCNVIYSAYAVVYTKANSTAFSSLSSGSTQATITYASNSTSSIGGAIRPVSVPMNVNMIPGEYYVGFNIVTGISSPGGATTSLGQTLTVMGGGQLQTNVNFAEVGSVTATSTNVYGGMGIYSAGTTGLASSYGFSNINQTGNAMYQANIALVFRNS